MTGPRHLAWDNFKATVLVSGEKRIHRIADTPRIDIVGDGMRNRIGMVMEVPPGAPLPPAISRLAFVEARLFDIEGRSFLEVSTERRSLHHEFYHLVTAAAERVLLHSESPITAVTSELDAFAALLEGKKLLGTEREIGLLGELLFLRELISRYGDPVLDSWIGPTGEPHDFRVGTHEFEVKTTLAPRRIHTINGAEQLVPSADCHLYVVSVLLAPAGNSTGFSLASTANGLAATFAPHRAVQFVALLESCDFSLNDAEHYSRRFAERRRIALVPVDATFPAITRPVLQQALGLMATRIDSFSYDVSLDGLEHPHGTPSFEAAMSSEAST